MTHSYLRHDSLTFKFARLAPISQQSMSQVTHPGQNVSLSLSLALSVSHSLFLYTHTHTHTHTHTQNDAYQAHEHARSTKIKTRYFVYDADNYTKQ